mmetsp:Transcript_12986/g.23434  ORF Transcript_12986/g.23434 Transcript_12986/m.23434 type:complete len:87 (+) Transcript_12986:404-664(+)
MTNNWCSRLHLELDGSNQLLKFERELTYTLPIEGIGKQKSVETSVVSFQQRVRRDSFSLLLFDDCLDLSQLFTARTFHATLILQLF